MNREKIAYFLLIISFVLLIINVYTIGFDNLSSNFLNPLTNVLLIIAMLLTIKDINKKKTDS